MAHIGIQENDIQVVGDRRRVNELGVLRVLERTHNELVYRVVAILLELISYS